MLLVAMNDVLLLNLIINNDLPDNALERFANVKENGIQVEGAVS